MFLIVFSFLFPVVLSFFFPLLLASRIFAEFSSRIFISPTSFCLSSDFLISVIFPNGPLSLIVHASSSCLFLRNLRKYLSTNQRRLSPDVPDLTLSPTTTPITTQKALLLTPCLPFLSFPFLFVFFASSKRKMSLLQRDHLRCVLSFLVGMEMQANRPCSSPFLLMAHRGRRTLHSLMLSS
ncbi:hypothetical protein CSUI_004646 [Cystoisospora suis]|uniref:Transmembrane protein n=1 Tax=Cystoisospora suis TaxID=483139 RepID=A0A2C6L0R9_9APIC|nr:hypothetical protein CSUI_004646 [Cystoisospora suis]